MSTTLTMARPANAGSKQRKLLSGVSALAGTGFTALLFFSIAQLGRIPTTKPVIEIDDLRTVSMPIEPPPPPRVVPPTPTEPVATITGFESLASESPVKIAATPPDLEAILPPPAVAPPARIQIGELHADFKPRLDLATLDKQIYQAREVDKLPEALYRANPRVPEKVRDNAKSLNVVMLVLIDAEGIIQSVQLAASSGNPQFDAIMMQSIHDWTFAPAMRKGKKVKCLMEQKITVNWTGGSLLSY